MVDRYFFKKVTRSREVDKGRIFNFTRRFIDPRMATRIANEAATGVRDV